MVTVTLRRRVPPVLIRKDAPVAAGVAVRATDTGRILMLQRSINDESDPARGKWEFPGGKLDPGEAPCDAAIREWQEETGVPLPAGDLVGCWRNAGYHGCVYVIANESDVALNLPADDRTVVNPDDPDGDDIEVLAWWPPTEAQANPGLRPEVADANWQLIHQAVPEPVFKAVRTLFAKDQPSGASVHVDTPTGSISVAVLPKGKRPRKPVDVGDDDTQVTIVKTDTEKRVVYGIVLEPDVEDSQGDVVSKTDVEVAAHRYLYVRGEIGDQHRRFGLDQLRPVESYIAPCDFQLGGQTVRKGSWVLAAHIPDDDLWQQVLDGRKTGWSVGGTGIREPL